MGVPGWPVLDAEGSSTAVGGPGSWDFGKRWVDFLEAGGDGVGRARRVLVSVLGHRRGQGAVDSSGRGSGEGWGRAGLFVLYWEFGHLVGCGTVLGVLPARVNSTL